jgi:hypothetical protein
MNKTFFIAIATISIMFSCKKTPVNQSTVHGTVTYISSYSSTSYIADGATVQLYTTNLSLEKTTTTNSSGEYSFSNVNDGSHVVSANGTYTLLNYTGNVSTSVSGDDNKTVNVSMK